MENCWNEYVLGYIFIEILFGLTYKTYTELLFNLFDTI